MTKQELLHMLLHEHCIITKDPRWVFGVQHSDMWPKEGSALTHRARLLNEYTAQAVELYKKEFHRTTIKRMVEIIWPDAPYWQVDKTTEIIEAAYKHQASSL